MSVASTHIKESEIFTENFLHYFYVLSYATTDLCTIAEFTRRKLQNEFETDKFPHILLASFSNPPFLVHLLVIHLVNILHY